VRPVLLFPDRHDFFEPVDGVATGFKRLSAMRTAYHDGHADVAQLEPAEPMDKHDVSYRPAGSCLSLDLRQLLLGHSGIGLIVKRNGAAALGHLANGPEKHQNGAAILSADQF